MRRDIALPVAIAVMVALCGAAVLMLAACAPPDDPAQLRGMYLPATCPRLEEIRT
jgi:hypothetical protein